MSDDIEDQDDYYDRPSKSQRKRDAHAAQDIGEQLVAMKEQQILAFDLPDVLSQAILQAKTITAHSARKRQLQYIGKLMRKVDLEAIVAKLEETTRDMRENKKQFHEAEQWRDRLVQDNAMLDSFVEKYPHVDRTELNSLMLHASNASTQKKYKKLLFRFITDTISKAQDIPQ